MQTATPLKQDTKSLDELLGEYYRQFSGKHPFGFLEGNLDALARKISRDCSRFRGFSSSEIATQLRRDGVLIEKETGATSTTRNGETRHRYNVVLANR